MRFLLHIPWSPLSTDAATRANYVCSDAGPGRHQEAWRPKRTPVSSRSWCSVQGSSLTQEKITSVLSNPLEGQSWPTVHTEGGAWAGASLEERVNGIPQSVGNTALLSSTKTRVLCPCPVESGWIHDCFVQQNMGKCSRRSP